MARTISTFGQVRVTMILALANKHSEIQLLQHEDNLKQVSTQPEIGCS